MTPQSRMTPQARRAPQPLRPLRTPEQPSLLLVVDPAAREWDAESVRIARDVLCAGAPGVKLCLPESPEEAERALARRGSRRPVVVGDDRALLRAVRLLYRERELEEAGLAVVPVGEARTVALTCGLGVPANTVTAARTVLDGVERRLGLLTDDSGGVVLGRIRIPGPAAAEAPRGVPGWARRVRYPAGQRLRVRVEADGELLADLDRPVTEVSVASPTVPSSPGRQAAADEPSSPGLARVTVRTGGLRGAEPVRARAKAVTVSGPDFHYRADALVGGPVRMRTWTALAGAWGLTLPA